MEIDKDALVKKLLELGAQDDGETMLEETIIYDRELKWRDEQRFIRLRKIGSKTILTYKEHKLHTIDGVYELESEVSDLKNTETILEKIGLKTHRHQQKKRHTLQLNGVTFDIDTWPRIPTYVELEGESEAKIKDAAAAVSLDWNKVEFHDARWVIENIYKIPVGQLQWFTFDRFE